MQPIAYLSTVAYLLLDNLTPAMEAVKRLGESASVSGNTLMMSQKTMFKCEKNPQVICKARILRLETAQNG